MDRLKPIEHRFKALMFRLLKPLLRRPQGKFQPLDGNKLTRVLFLRPEKVGDMVISFPVFDGLKERFPHLKISILGSPRSEAIIRHDPRFEHIYMYRKNLWKDFKEVLQMRRNHFDCVVDMICDDSVTALFLSQICVHGRPRIGVGKVKFREYYDFNYDHRMGDTGHIIQNTLKLLEAFGIDSKSVPGYAAPYVDAESHARIEEFLQAVNNGSHPVPLIGYNLSAGAPTRLWADENNEELLRRILEHTPTAGIVLFTMPSERFRGERLAARLSQGVYQVPPNMSLLEASALISRLDLLISPDTSLVHIARAFKVPVVGLYSRFMKNFLLWRPYGQEVGAVVSGSNDNIHDITVEQVFDMYLRVLEANKLVTQ